MEIGLNTLLVALMFVTVLSMGIGNILTTLADVFNPNTSSRRDPIHVAWISLLLIIHFNLFWHTKAILEVDEWTFGGFLLAIAGPVLIFLSTSILLTCPSAKEPQDMHDFFVAVGRRFFGVFALVQGWIILAGFTMTGGFVLTDLVNVAFLLLAVLLAGSSARQVHLVGVVVAWSLGAASVVIRGLYQVG